MKIVIFGLTISSSWGNGHATLWRGLCRGLAKRGHRVVFFEKDVPYYAAHRDLHALDCGQLHVYRSWEEVLPMARRELADAEVGMVTSYCPDGVAATDLVVSSSVGVRAFYDLDTPVTLSELQRGRQVSYIGPRGLRDFDLVLSYTGGAALSALQSDLGARRVAPLYGSVDPEVHCPVPSVAHYRCDLSYLGTYAEDRQDGVERLLVEPARKLPRKKFIIGGAQYPQQFPWTNNIYFVSHLPPAEHPAFFCSSRLTLNVTRAAMAAMGYCPSGRLFEAAACGAPILSDYWVGLDQFFTPGAEILIAHTTAEAVHAIELPDHDLNVVAKAARERVLAEHTAERRAIEMETALVDAASSVAQEPPRLAETATASAA